LRQLRRNREINEFERMLFDSGMGSQSSAAMNCNSSKISEFGQKLGGKLAVICARPSHSRQAFVDGHDWQRRSAVVYNKPKRGNTPPLGSMPRHCITLEAWVVRCSSVVEVGMIVFSSLSILRKNIGSRMAPLP
jgi:hypothetical protein